MEDVLARLSELSSDIDRVDRRPVVAVQTEVQHLWKTLETLLGTTKPHELRVDEPAFSKLLACIHAVVKSPLAWRADAPKTTTKSVFESTNRVLVKVGCRGEYERCAILDEGFVSSLVACLQKDKLEFSSGEVAAVLHVFQTLAFDTNHRVELMNYGTVPVVLASMRRFQQDLNVQLVGCKFLQFMAYQEETKELIIQSNGVAVILEALELFSNDAQLATSASDVLYFLSLDLENVLSQQDTKLMNTMEAIVRHVVKLMGSYPKIEQIQTHGIAILLTFGGSNASARRQLCSFSEMSTLWTVAAAAFDSNEDASADTVDLLRILLHDPQCFEMLESKCRADTTPQDAKRQMIKSLTGIKSRLEIKQSRTKSKNIAFTIGQLQRLVDVAQAHELPSHVSQTGRGRDERMRDDSERFLDQESPTKKDDSAFEDNYFDQFVQVSDDTDVSTSSTQEDTHGVNEKQAGELPGHDRVRLSSSSDYTLNSPNCTQFSGGKLSGDLASQKTKDCHCGFSVPPNGTTNLQLQHDRARRDLQDVESEYQLLQENYAIVVRRAQEQSKLLNIQNSRIKHYMEVHQQVLERVKTLETALSDALRKHQVERELRLAEVAQAEKISLSLHEAMTEIKTLNKHNSNTSRELMHKEKLRVDYQQKASMIRQQQQKLEYERDDAMIQMLAMKTEQRELNKQLEETRREASEALHMREEDIDAPKPSAFSEMLSLSPSSRARKISNYTLTTKRVVAEANDRQLRHHEHRKSMFAGSAGRAVRPTDAAVMRKASLYGSQVICEQSTRSANIMVINGELQHDGDDDSESMMEPPKEDLRYYNELQPVEPMQQGLDKHKIESTLRTAYESFDKSPDSHGVHIATVRRFFSECGIVQPPLVAGDVDTILTRVLNQAQENRKRIMVRKDFTMATYPSGMGSSNSHNKAADAKRFRFFDEESFFEAVTLLSMRRFPRHDAKKALEVFITDFLHPMQRQQQQLSMHRRSSTGSASSSMYHSAPTRSGSMRSTSGGGSSPTAACIGILKAVLNGLALHIGQDDEAKQADPRFLTKLDSSTNTLLLPSGHHGRKPKPEDVVYSMLEMHGVLAREYKPLATICEFYSAMHHTPRDLMMKDESVTPLSFELVLAFAMDFEIIPSFMDRLSLKHLHSEVSGYLKKFLALQKKMPPPHVVDAEMLKKVAFSMLAARLAMELFGSKREYETPEKQITALMQWLDNSVGREKIQKKAMLPIVIKFSRKLYALRV